MAKKRETLDQFTNYFQDFSLASFFHIVLNVIMFATFPVKGKIFILLLYFMTLQTTSIVARKCFDGINAADSNIYSAICHL